MRGKTNYGPELVKRARHMYVTVLEATTKSVAEELGLPKWQVGYWSNRDEWVDQKRNLMTRRWRMKLGENQIRYHRLAKRQRRAGVVRRVVSINDLPPENLKKAMEALTRIKESKGETITGKDMALEMMRDTMTKERSIKYRQGGLRTGEPVPLIRVR